MKNKLFLLAFLLTSFTIYSKNTHKQINKYDDNQTGNKVEDCRRQVDKILASDVSYEEKLKNLLTIDEKCAGNNYFDLAKAQIYATNKQMEKALKVINTKRDFGELQESFVVLEAKIYAFQEDTPHAQSVLRNYLRENPGGYKVHLFLAQLLSSERKFDEALDSYIESAKAKPTAKAYHGAAVAQYALGNCEQAVGSIEQAVVLDEESTLHDLGSMVIMSRCYARQGKFVVATNALKMLLQNNPDAKNNSDFQEALYDLRERIKKAKESGDVSTDADKVQLEDLKY